MIVAKRPTVLLAILDGWGLGEPVETNAVHIASTPVMDRLLADYPHSTLRTSGEDVGLPEGQMGNSEVGHLNIGAGHIVYQWITRIDRDIADGTFFGNDVLRSAFERAETTGNKVHLMGLVGNGGVHSHQRHLLALITMAEMWPAVPVRIHVFTDGRDSAPDSALTAVRELQSIVDSSPNEDISIASVSGRYFAMDRDHRWDRTQSAFEVVTGNDGPVKASAIAAIQDSYDASGTDEFIEPVRIGSWGEASNRMKHQDETIFFNFRSDRARQLSEALAMKDFQGFNRGESSSAPVYITTMTSYEKHLPVRVAYQPHDVVNPIAKIISDAGLTQFHAAETEKYPHVTFFLNGGREEPFPGEDRTMIPSPKVATYDLQPEMSADAVCDAVVHAIEGDTYGFIIVNFANADMVGHTGDIQAARIAAETVDACLGRIVEALADVSGIALVTADHGNAEVMRVPGTDDPMTAHTTNPVPVVLVAPEDSPLRTFTLRNDGRLSAIGTTVIDVLGLPHHPDMTEPSLLKK